MFFSIQKPGVPNQSRHVSLLSYPIGQPSLEYSKILQEQASQMLIGSGQSKTVARHQG